eukprot:2765196-Prymnesium_polylepis.1
MPLSGVTLNEPPKGGRSTVVVTVANPRWPSPSVAVRVNAYVAPAVSIVGAVRGSTRFSAASGIVGGSASYGSDEAH